MCADALRGKVCASGTHSWSVIDANTHASATPRIEGKDKRYVINLVTEGCGQCLLATDSADGELLVVGIASARLIHSVEIGEGALGVRHDARRHEFHASSREAGTVQILDGDRMRSRAWWR